MSAEFEELMKARDNPSEEAQSEFKQHVLVLSQEHVCTTCKCFLTFSFVATTKMGSNEETHRK